MVNAHAVAASAPSVVRGNKTEVGAHAKAVLSFNSNMRRKV